VEEKVPRAAESSSRARGKSASKLGAGARHDHAIVAQHPDAHMPTKSPNQPELAMTPYTGQPLAATGHAVSVMSSTRRGFLVQDGEIYKAVAVMGEATIFIDGSELAGGTAEVRCVAVMGNVTVYVQPGIDVEANGVGVLGMFEQWGGRAHGAGVSKVRITGVAVLGFVKVVTGNP
jgi:hypothetical protein